MLTSTPNYLTKSSVCWISTHHYAQVGFAVGSTTTTSCQTKHVARSNSIEDGMAISTDWSTVGQTGLPLSLLVKFSSLLQRLQTEFEVTGTVLSWLRSHLSCRSQFVKLGNHQSPAVNLNVGVPQESVLGPIVFAVYCSPVGDVIAWHCVHRTVKLCDPCMSALEVLTTMRYTNRRILYFTLPPVC